MLLHLYLRNKIVYLPTVAQTEAGFYIDIEPVKVVPAAESQALQNAILEIMAKGNPVVPTPTRAAFSKPVLLNYAKVKSWSAFEKNTSVWTIDKKGGKYYITPGRSRADKGWEDDLPQMESLPLNAPLDTVAQRVAYLVLDRSRKLKRTGGAQS
ncbi:MAG TPA: hypothetical protein VH413_10560 [Verrucomicrobiae bacterium]|jgi:hypothetical protein|nr:hypothetical protein [Verrucomicrobiae bacterium]